MGTIFLKDPAAWVGNRPSGSNDFRWEKRMSKVRLMFTFMGEQRLSNLDNYSVV
jgi:hypothetical protein